ncbi:MAG: hypothetical protein E7474_10380 [Ruminococcaceae bacterium]|nr:hypothetical protein [Oscillospiraceae bacterium]
MKKLFRSALVLLTAAVLSVPAFADVIDEPRPEPGSFLPVLAIAVVLIAAVLLVVTIRRRKRK